jgi:hypothetical protein
MQMNSLTNKSGGIPRVDDRIFWVLPSFATWRDLPRHPPPMAAAVAIGTLIGPSAVGARVVEKFAPRRYHPIWTMIISAVAADQRWCLVRRLASRGLR